MRGILGWVFESPSHSRNHGKSKRLSYGRKPTQYCEGIFHQLKHFFKYKKTKDGVDTASAWEEILGWNLQNSASCLEKNELRLIQLRYAVYMQSKQQQFLLGPGWLWGTGVASRNAAQLSPHSPPAPRQLLLLGPTWLQNGSLLKYQAGPLAATLTCCNRSWRDASMKQQSQTSIPQTLIAPKERLWCVYVKNPNYLLTQ